MSTYDKRLDAVEKDIVVMKRDIIYKLDDTNSAVGILQGVLGRQGQDIKFLINQTKMLDLRLDNLEGRMATFEQSVNSRFEAQSKQLETLDSKLESGIETSCTSNKNRRIVDASL